MVNGVHSRFPVLVRECGPTHVLEHGPVLVVVQVVEIGCGYVRGRALLQSPGINK